MKNKIIIALIFITTIFSINAQNKPKYENYCAKYKVYFSTPSDVVIYNMLIDDIENKLNEVICELVVKNDESSFSAIYPENFSTDEINNFNDIILTYGYRSYYNNSINYTMYEKSDEWLEYIKIYDWELLPESKIINGYKCYKAVCRIKNKLFDDYYKDENKLTAWYTPDIKSPFGPNATGKLPGLIVRLEQIVTTFELVSIQECNQKISIDAKKPVITFANYYDLYRE